jgi:cardiolipin synthase (CMP-forming)
MKKEKLLTIPNVLSGYRIVAFPVIMWTIYTGEKHFFITLLLINLITDILDGLIARTFKLETEFGAKLDSFADLGSYILAFTGMIVLENTFVSQHIAVFLIMMSLYASTQITSLIRFKRTTCLHLYSSKATGYAQGIFMFTYFFIGYNSWYFYFMIMLSCIAYSEALVIVLSLPAMRPNVKGIYFMLRDNKRIM